jgi:hypothetical protein
MESPEAWRIQSFPPLESRNIVDGAAYPRMYKLVTRADFDGKGLNKNMAESIVFSNKRGYKIPTFSTRIIVRILRLFPTFGVHSELPWAPKCTVLFILISTPVD